MVPFPSPNGDKKPDLRSHGWELGMSARSTHKQEAWTFMKWLVSKGPNAAMAKASKNIPANKTSDVSFLKDNPRLTEAVNIINNYQLVEELMMMPKATASWTVLTQETSKMITAGQSPEVTAANTDKGWASIK
jgi:multiple sugar transport system substrate-binding protein